MKPWELWWTIVMLWLLGCVVGAGWIGFFLWMNGRQQKRKEPEEDDVNLFV